MTQFNPQDKEHKAIVLDAMCAADALGAGRITAAKEHLELNDIAVADWDRFTGCVLAWGKDI